MPESTFSWKKRYNVFIGCGGVCEVVTGCDMIRHGITSHEGEICEIAIDELVVPSWRFRRFAPNDMA